MLKKILLIPFAPIYFAVYNLRYHLEQTALLSFGITILTLFFPMFLPLYLLWGFFLVKFGAIPGTGERSAILSSNKISKVKLKKPVNDLKLTVFQTGKIESGSWGVYEGASKPIIMDQPAFLIRHPKYGYIMFEAGIHPEVSKDPVNYVGPFLFYGGFLQMKQKIGQDAYSQVKKFGVDPEKIKTIYVSHLHPEHGGAIEKFGNSAIAVDKIEYGYAFNEPKYNYFKKEYVPVKHWKLLDFTKAKNSLKPFGGSFDVFNDGSVLVVSTPGHTPGSISMLLNLPEGPVFLVGDIAWRMESMSTKTIGMPFVSVDPVDHRKALGKLTSFIKVNPEIAIVPTHDLSSLRQSNRKDVEIVE